MSLECEVHLKAPTLKELFELAGRALEACEIEILSSEWTGEGDDAISSIATNFFSVFVDRPDRFHRESTKRLYGTEFDASIGFQLIGDMLLANRMMFRVVNAILLCTPQDLAFEADTPHTVLVRLNGKTYIEDVSDEPFEEITVPTTKFALRLLPSPDFPPTSKK